MRLLGTLSLSFLISLTMNLDQYLFIYSHDIIFATSFIVLYWFFFSPSVFILQRQVVSCIRSKRLDGFVRWFVLTFTWKLFHLKVANYYLANHYEADISKSFWTIEFTEPVSCSSGYIIIMHILSINNVFTNLKGLLILYLGPWVKCYPSSVLIDPWFSYFRL